MSILRHVARNIKQSLFSNFEMKLISGSATRLSSNETVSARMQEFRKKLEETPPPFGKLGEPLEEEEQREEDPLKPWPNNTNPHTGEIGGPRGPEPTRYGDWERNGRAVDF